MDIIKTILITLISTTLINNVVLSQFILDKLHCMV